MQFVTPKPLNSALEVVSEGNRTTISWKNPRGGAGRYGAAIFMLAWLGGWAVGEIFVIKALISGGLGGSGFFFLFWLAGWTVGGIFAMRNVYFLLRPAKPEILSFDALTLNYKQGAAPGDVAAWNNKKREDEISSNFRNSKPKYTI